MKTYLPYHAGTHIVTENQADATIVGDQVMDPIFNI